MSPHIDSFVAKSMIYHQQLNDWKMVNIVWS